MAPCVAVKWQASRDPGDPFFLFFCQALVVCIFPPFYLNPGQEKQPKKHLSVSFTK